MRGDRIFVQCSKAHGNCEQRVQLEICRSFFSLVPGPMRQVWILNHYAQEPNGAGGTRHYSLAKNLYPLGWRAVVIAASVELNTGRQRLNDHETSRLDCINGVDFLWLRTPRHEGNGGGRIWNMLIYSIRVLLPKSTRQLPRPDVVVGSSVHPFAAFSGAWLARRFGVPFVFEVRDLWPQTLVDMRRLKPNSLATRILKRLEIWLYRRAARIVVLLPRASDYIVPLGIAGEKIVWVPNGVELEDYPVPCAPEEHGRFTLMYFGAHGQANGLHCILRAMQILQDNPSRHDVRLKLIGDGPLKPELMTWARAVGLRNVEFLDPVPRKMIPALAATADAFIISVVNLPNLYRFGISMNKIFDYLAAARPIIIASDAVNNPVADSGAGITVQPDVPEAIAEAILRLEGMPLSDRCAMGLAGRVYVEKYHTYSMLAKRLASIFDEVVSES